jgi:pyruvate/2-oxoglutarate/acetoin dehydrogenase E1 component
MVNYFDELTRTMTELSKYDKVKFIGQSVVWDGHALFKTLKNVPIEKRLELPVSEDFQLGLSTGLALEGFIPISIYPRMDFLILAANQLTNHLVNIATVSKGGYKPRVIIRTSMGATGPLYSGLQHCQDHSAVFRLLCRNGVEVIELRRKDQIFSSYIHALTREDCKPTLLIEYGDLYSLQEEVNVLD